MGPTYTHMGPIWDPYGVHVYHMGPIWDPHGPHMGPILVRQGKMKFVGKKKAGIVTFKYHVCIILPNPTYGILILSYPNRLVH